MKTLQIALVLFGFCSAACAAELWHCPDHPREAGRPEYRHKDIGSCRLVIDAAELASGTAIMDEDFRRSVKQFEAEKREKQAKEVMRRYPDACRKDEEKVWGCEPRVGMPILLWMDALDMSYDGFTETRYGRTERWTSAVCTAFVKRGKITAVSC